MAEHRPYRHHECDADRRPSQKRSVAAQDQGAHDDARHHGERPLEVIDEPTLLIHEATISHRGVGRARIVDRPARVASTLVGCRRNGKPFGVSVVGVGGCWCARSRPVSVTTMRRDPSQE
jgi:hypothetical protein